MLHFEVPLPRPAPEDGESLIETCCRDAGLIQGLKGTLIQYPGCIHWHWKRHGEPGTLEVTLWPRENRLWLSLHANRFGAWTEAAAPALRETLRARLARG
jgi:hypothetical protein